MSNGFTAADMSTAAANGFRDGMAAQPAAAQEAGQIIAWCWPSTGVVCSAEAVSRDRAPTDNAIPLYAAPVAAAPVDDGMLPDALVPYSKEWYTFCERRFAVDKIKISGDLACAIVDVICARQTSTPAAPADPCKRCDGEGTRWNNAAEEVTECGACNASAAAASGIDPADPWRGLYTPELMPKLDGVNDWIASHPDLPQWPDDEERGIDNLIKAQGFAYAVVSDEYPDDEDSDTCAWLANWKPEPPAGEQWRLVMIQDTEDGPAAVYVRPLALIDASPKGGINARATFERWALSQNLSVQRDEFHIGMGGDYSDRVTDRAWEAWQAAMQATSAEVGS